VQFFSFYNVAGLPVTSPLSLVRYAVHYSCRVEKNRAKQKDIRLTRRFHLPCTSSMNHLCPLGARPVCLICLHMYSTWLWIIQDPTESLVIGANAMRFLFKFQSHFILFSKPSILHGSSLIEHS
jgi:hypothetical protein